MEFHQQKSLFGDWEKEACFETNKCAGLELLTSMTWQCDLTDLEEEQEDGLPDGAAHLRVLELVFDFCLPEKDVSATRAPQHLLERRKPLAGDDTGHEAEVDAPDRRDKINDSYLLKPKTINKKWKDGNGEQRMRLKATIIYLKVEIVTGTKRDHWHGCDYLRSQVYRSLLIFHNIN